MLEINGHNILPFDVVFIQHPRLPSEPLGASERSIVVLGMGIGLGISGGVVGFSFWSMVLQGSSV